MITITGKPVCSGVAFGPVFVFSREESTIISKAVMMKSLVLNQHVSRQSVNLLCFMIRLLPKSARLTQ